MDPSDAFGGHLKDGLALGFGVSVEDHSNKVPVVTGVNRMFQPESIGQR